MRILIACLLGIAFLSFCPQSVPLADLPDWFGHALAYGGLTALALANWPQRSAGIALCVFSLGAVIELGQSFTPDRTVSWDDLAANSVGIAVVIFWRTVAPFVYMLGVMAIAGCGSLPTPNNIDPVAREGGYQLTQRSAMRDEDTRNQTDAASEARYAPPFAERVQETIGRCRPHESYAHYPIMPRQTTRGALGSGDLIRVTVGKDKLLSGTYEIEADGALHLPHLRTLKAVGRTPNALTQDLRDALLADGLYRAPLPAVSVETLERGAIRVSVAGAVFEPGTVQVIARTAEDRDPVRQDALGDAAYRYGLTAALRAAAGLRPDAELENILIKRGGDIWRVNLVSAMHNGAFHDPVLHPGDEIHVPSLGCFQPGLARPTIATRKGIKVHLSNLTQPANSNAQSAIDDDVREVVYGTRLLQVLVRMNCVGGIEATNAPRMAVLISRNPVTGETEVIERAIEDLVRHSNRASHDPVLMSGDAIACYDSTVTNARDIARGFIELFAPVPIVSGL